MDTLYTFCWPCLYLCHSLMVLLYKIVALAWSEPRYIPLRYAYRILGIIVLIKKRILFYSIWNIFLWQELIQVYDIFIIHEWPYAYIIEWRISLWPCTFMWKLVKRLQPLLFILDNEVRDINDQEHMSNLLRGKSEEVIKR